ncbi:hypothetical protein SAMN05421827_101528 [Pedobacter terrae]|uniref:Uncharacterized protein n=1 Tax=Pedobacter terrae TaxID=405671 RepID=A0A1G7NVV4_9SPHI|nr:hypothetical protein SAMN05421827_101528 [Pedobacter terrae]
MDSYFIALTDAIPVLISNLPLIKPIYVKHMSEQEA